MSILVSRARVPSRRRGPGVRSMLTVLCVAGMTAGSPAVRAQSGAKDVALGFARSLFAEHDIRDATAALEVYATEFSRKAGLPYVAKVTLYDDAESFAAAVQRGDAQVICLPITDYFRVRTLCALEPVIVPTMRGSFMEDRVVIVHRGSGFRDLRALRGRSIAFSKGTRSEITLRWMAVELHHLKEQKPEAFLSKVVRSKNEEQAVMSVFFRNSDAAIVTSRTLETMMEQNPQLKQDLVIIVRSPGYMYSIVCLAKSMDERDKTRVRAASMTMSTYQGGRQILRIFRYDGVKSYEPSDISTVQELERQYQLLPKPSGRKRP
jgi:ABC-type phosphate/phosphonate transport system substrate-binding protein